MNPETEEQEQDVANRAEQAKDELTARLDAATTLKEISAIHDEIGRQRVKGQANRQKWHENDDRREKEKKNTEDAKTLATVKPHLDKHTQTLADLSSKLQALKLPKDRTRIWRTT